MRKEEKKGRSPINPQGQESREKESQGWAEAETGQVPEYASILREAYRQQQLSHVAHGIHKVR